MHRPHLMIISQIPLWSMGKATGGPAFRETLTHLGRRFDVSLVTPALDYVDESAIPAGVSLHTFHHYLHGVARHIRKIGWVTDTLGWYTFRASAWPIVNRIHRQKPIDLVYGYEIYGVPVAKRASRRFAIPMIARYQGTLMSSRIKERLPHLRYHKHLAALRIRADLVIMTDDGTLGGRVLDELGHDPATVRFWMNGVDLSIADSPVTGEEVRAQLGIAEGIPLLLTVSRLSHWKRLDRAIDVASLLHEQSVPVALAIVGAGPEEAALRERAAVSAAAGHVHFIGGVERQRLAGFYRAADVLLSLYDHSNLANPVIEAMVLGTPLVALDVGGTSNLIEDEVNGIMVTDPSPRVIAERVLSLLTSPDERRALGQRAASWSRENLWTWDDRMDAEVVEIERLLARSRT